MLFLKEESKKNEILSKELLERSMKSREKGDLEEAKFFMSVKRSVDLGIMMDHEPTYHGMCPRCQKPMGNHAACYCKHCGQMVDKEPLAEYLE